MPLRFGHDSFAQSCHCFHEEVGSTVPDGFTGSRLRRHVERGPEAADGSHEKVLVDAFLFTLMGSRKMAPSSRGEGCELSDGSTARRFRRHALLEAYDGFTADGSVVTWKRVLKALRDTQWQRFGPRLRRISVLYCLRELVFLVIFFAEVAFLFRTLSWVFQAQATIRKWPGCVLLDGLGAIPGSPAEVEGGFAFA